MLFNVFILKSLDVTTSHKVITTEYEIMYYFVHKREPIRIKHLKAGVHRLQFSFGIKP